MLGIDDNVIYGGFKEVRGEIFRFFYDRICRFFYS